MVEQRDLRKFICTTALDTPSQVLVLFFLVAKEISKNVALIIEASYFLIVRKRSATHELWTFVCFTDFQCLFGRNSGVKYMHEKGFVHINCGLEVDSEYKESLMRSKSSSSLPGSGKRMTLGAEAQ